jgi:hypothetical protein
MRHFLQHKVSKDIYGKYHSREEAQAILDKWQKIKDQFPDAPNICSNFMLEHEIVEKPLSTNPPSDIKQWLDKWRAKGIYVTCTDYNY